MTARTHRSWSPDPDDLQIRIKSAYELLRKGLRDRATLKLHDAKRRARYIEDCIESAGLRRTSVERHFRLRAECVLQGRERFCHNPKCENPGDCRRCPIILRR